MKAFESLQFTGYRWYWIGGVLGPCAINMQTLARGWLIYEMTHSTLLLGIVGGAIAIPIVLIAPIGGVIADRIDKRSLIMTTEIVNGSSALIMTILLYANIIEVWHIIVITLISGIAMALNVPSRQGIISELVDRDHLLNGIALFSMGANSMRILGPMLAGILTGIIGVKGVFLSTVIIFAIVVYSMFKIGPTPIIPRTIKTGFFEDFIAGLKYVLQHKIILIIILFGYVISLIGGPYMTLLPAFARDVLKLDSSGLGFMTSAAGIGAVVGAIGIASLGDFKRKGMMMLSVGIIFGLGLILFSFSESFPVSLFALLIVGAANTICMMINQTIIQSNVEHEILGRVISLYMITLGLQGVSAIPIGAIAEVAGAPISIGVCGIILAVFAFILLFAVPRLRKY